MMSLNDMVIKVLNDFEDLHIGGKLVYEDYVTINYQSKLRKEINLVLTKLKFLGAKDAQRLSFKTEVLDLQRKCQIGEISKDDFLDYIFGITERLQEQSTSVNKTLKR